MKHALVIVVLFVLATPFFAQSSVNIYSTVSYNSGTNQVTSQSYTQPSYHNAMYYNTYVNGYIRNSDGTQLASGSAGGGSGQATVNLSVTGNGCDYYQGTASHYQTMTYWVTNYYYNGSYYTGNWDNYNYMYFNGDGGGGFPYLGNFAYFGPGPSYSTYSTHIIFGGTEQWSQGSCSNAPKIRSIGPSYGAPGVARTVTITGNGFTGSTTVEVSNGNVTVGTVTYVNPQRLTVVLTPADTMTQGNFDINVDNGGTNSNTKSFNVRVPHHLRVITDQHGTPPVNGPPLNCGGAGLLNPMMRQIVMEIQDSNNNPVGPVPMKEVFSSLSTNTCRADGVGPSADSCATTMYDAENGRILDSITVACNSVGGTCGYDIAGEWHWCPAGQSSVKLGTLNSNVRHNGVTTNGYAGGSSMAGTNVAP